MKNKRIVSIIMAATVTVLPALPHNISYGACSHNWVLDSSSSWEATCTDEGRRWYDCPLCGDYKTEKVPATGIHKWSAWEIYSNATCTEQGEERRECSECYKTEKKTIPATGVHKWTEWKPDSYLCEDGKDTRYCEDCYKEETRARKGDGSHLWSDWEVNKEPDCLNEGQEYRKCYNCYFYEYESIPADDDLHEWSSWYADSEATALHNGKTRRVCYICNEVEEKTVKKLKAKITLSAKKKTLKVGKSFRILVKRYTYGDLLKGYKSSNKSVAVVRDTGWVTAMKKGKATITVTMESGCKAKCQVIVK